MLFTTHLPGQTIVLRDRHTQDHIATILVHRVTTESPYDADGRFVAAAGGMTLGDGPDGEPSSSIEDAFVVIGVSADDDITIVRGDIDQADTGRRGGCRGECQCGKGRPHAPLRRMPA